MASWQFFTFDPFFEWTALTRLEILLEFDVLFGRKIPFLMHSFTSLFWRVAMRFCYYWADWFGKYFWTSFRWLYMEGELATESWRFRIRALRAFDLRGLFFVGSYEKAWASSCLCLRSSILSSSSLYGFKAAVFAVSFAIFVDPVPNDDFFPRL